MRLRLRIGRSDSTNAGNAKVSTFDSNSSEEEEYLCEGSDDEYITCQCRKSHKSSRKSRARMPPIVIIR